MNHTPEILDVLTEALEYFADREDADHNGERYVPNKEMRLAQAIREVIDKMEAAA